MKQFAALFVFITLVPLQAGEWLRFRGENGSGISEQGALPDAIGADKKYLWKTAVPAGKSSPVVTKDRIYLTGHQSGKLLTFALDRKSGEGTLDPRGPWQS